MKMVRKYQERKLSNNKSTTANSTYTQVGGSCFYESEVLNQSSVLLMKFSAKNPNLRVGAKRCRQFYLTSKHKILTIK